MKKSILLLIAALALMSCEGPEGPMGPAGAPGAKGRDGESVGWYTTSITVDASEWKLDGDPDDLNSYFYVYKPLNMMSNYIYKYGTVISYIQTGEGIKNGMPFVLHLGDYNGEKEFLWTETYDFDFDDGGIGFYVTYSDFSTGIRPKTKTFHVVLMW